MRAHEGKVTVTYPTPTDFALVRWFGREAFEAGAVGFSIPRRRPPRSFWDGWVTTRYPLGPHTASRLRADFAAEEAALRASLALHAELLPPQSYTEDDRGALVRSGFRRVAPDDFEEVPLVEGQTSEAGKLIVAYLLGPATPTRHARLSAALMRLLGEQDVFSEFADALLPGWRHYRQDAEKQERSRRRGGPYAWRADINKLAPSESKDDEQGNETDEEALSRLTGGAPDFAPALLNRLAHETADPGLLHRRDLHKTLTGAQKVALHRIRQHARSPLLEARDAIATALRTAGGTPEHHPYRKPRRAFSDPRDRLDQEYLRNNLTLRQRTEYHRNAADYVRHLRNLTERGRDPFVEQSKLTYHQAGTLGGAWDPTDTMLGLGTTSARRGNHVYAADGQPYRVIPHQQVSRAELKKRRLATERSRPVTPHSLERAR